MTASQEAADRLALSRERLRQAMRGTANRRDDPSLNAGSSATAWLNTFKSMPAARVVLEALAAWWAQHPLRMATLLATEAANTVVRPMAQRSPCGLVLAGLLLGGLLGWSRPWRWLVTPALFAGLLPQLLSKAMAWVPPSSWMAALADEP